MKAKAPMGNPEAPVLICRTDAIGDLVLTTPLFRMLRERFPAIEVDALVARRAAPILQGNPFIRQVLIDPVSLRERTRLIRSGGYRWAVIVRPEPAIAWAVWRAGVPGRVGTARRFYSPLFNARVELHRRHGGRHESEYNAALLKSLGVEGNVPHAEVIVSDSTRDAARSLLKSQGILPGEVFAVVHTGSRGSAPNLSYVQYSELIRELRSFTKIVLTGTPAEVQPLLDLLPDRRKDGGVVNLAGQTSLTQLIGILAGAGVVIASSTGPLHLAAAAGTPVVGVFGHAVEVSPTRWRPWVDPERVVIVQPDLAGCPGSCIGRCGRGGCLNHLNIDSVLQAARTLIRRENGS